MIKMDCCLEPDRQYCNGKCNRLLPCGHKCDKKCKEPCTDICKALVECSIYSPCGHTIKEIQCHIKDTGKFDLYKNTIHNDYIKII